MNQSESERMNCMEVWGGNRAIDKSFQAPGLKIWVHSRPYGGAEGGGDVYYLSSCASGRVTRLLLADVSGHGSQVARIATSLRDLMRRNVNYVQQTRFVRSMNQQFANFKKEDLFATALVGTFFAPTSRFTLSNAGHPSPLLFRRRTSEWTVLASQTVNRKGLSDMPLGVTDETTYDELKVKLEVGDMLLSFSDAFIESQGADGEQIGGHGILRLVRKLEMSDSNALIPQLIELITDLSNGNLKQDDATILLCQATGGGPSLMNSLLAPFRFFRQVVDRTKLK